MSSVLCVFFIFFFSSRRRHTRSKRDWSSDVCSSDLGRSARACEFSKPQNATLAMFTELTGAGRTTAPIGGDFNSEQKRYLRSEERRVGKEGRSGWWSYA